MVILSFGFLICLAIFLPQFKIKSHDKKELEKFFETDDNIYDVNQFFSSTNEKNNIFRSINNDNDDGSMTAYHDM